MSILSSEVLSINRCHFSLSLFTCIIFTSTIFSEILFIFFICSSYFFTHLFAYHLFLPPFHTKWPDLMNPTQLHRKPLHPRNTSQNLGNLVMNVLGNLGKMMNIMKNIMNAMKVLGNHRDRMKTFRVSLEPLVEWNRQWVLNKRGMLRERERKRRFNFLRSLPPRGRGLKKKMIPQCIEMGHWRMWPPNLKHPLPSSTMACSSIWTRWMN